jgi:hypothetical protein
MQAIAILNASEKGALASFAHMLIGYTTYSTLHNPSHLQAGFLFIYSGIMYRTSVHDQENGTALLCEYTVLSKGPIKPAS